MAEGLDKAAQLDAGHGYVEGLLLAIPGDVVARVEVGFNAGHGLTGFGFAQESSRTGPMAGLGARFRF